MGAAWRHRRQPGWADLLGTQSRALGASRGRHERLGCAAAFVGAILAELLITPVGIGDLITYNRSIADYPKMYAAILSIIVVSVLFIELLEVVEVTVFRPEKRSRA